jgi:O-antigen/teichoic acid export membrane protein
MDNKLKLNIIKGSAASSIGTISSMVFQFFTIMIMTRYVSKDDLGIYVLVIVIVNMFNLLGGLGVELTMIKYIASKKREDNQDVLLPVLIIRGFGSLIFSIVFVIIGRLILHLFDDRIYQYIYYILAIFILANYRDLFYNLMQGLHQFKLYSIVNVASSVFRVVLVVIFLFLGQLDIRILLIIEILSTVQPLIHQLFVIPFGKYLRVMPTWQTFKKVINFSIPLYLNNLVDFVNGQMNIFIIGAYLNPASIANFDVARKVPAALGKIFGAFRIVYFPNLVTLFSDGDKKTAVKLIEKSVGIFSISMAILFPFTFLFRHQLTNFLYSARYAEVSVAFALLIFNFFLKGLGNLMGYVFIPAGHPSVPTWINATTSIISIGLTFLFVPKFGYMGAVYALLVVNLISTFLFYGYLVKYTINPSLKFFLKPSLLFLIAPVSLFIKGGFSLLINVVLFLIILILSWMMSDELKDGVKFLIKYLKKFTTAKDAVL